MGFALTVLQTSSGTTVLVIGLVSAGLMTLKQAVGIIFGANIGTTMTSILIGLPVADYALLMIFIAVVMLVFFRHKMIKNIGTIILGFGLIFFGLEVMGDGLKPLVSNPFVKDMFLLFSDTSNGTFWFFGVWGAIYCLRPKFLGCEGSFKNSPPQCNIRYHFLLRGFPIGEISGQQSQAS